MDYIYDPYSNELYHYGVKGMKWGVRKKSRNEPNKNYTEKQRKSDRALYGKGAERRINRKMNDGYNVSTARHFEVERRQRINKTKRIAKNTARVVGPIALTIAVSELANRQRITAGEYYVNPYLNKTTKEVIDQRTNKSWSDYAWEEIERSGW